MIAPYLNSQVAVWRGHRALHQAGVGLVEIMVSLTIGLVIIAALVALFIGTSRNNRQMATANSMIENGRFAIQLLEEDVIHGGYWGQFVPEFDDQTSTVVPTDVPTAVPDPCLAYGSWDAAYQNDLLGIPAQSYETPPTGCGSVVIDQRPSTDVLVVRHVDTCFAGETGCEPDTTDKLYMQSSQCATESTPYVLGLTDTATFNLHTRTCAATLSEKRRFVSHIYYVRDVVTTDEVGNSTVIPTLMRSEFDSLAVGTAPAHQEAVALVEGIDGFRVEFGIDDLSKTGAPVDYTTATVWQDPDTKTTATNRGDGIPDGNYLRCTDLVPCTAADLLNTTSVRIYVLARSREPTRGYVDTKTYSLGAGTTPLGPYNDGYKRHVYTTTVRLPNIGGRRERP